MSEHRIACYRRAPLHFVRGERARLFTKRGESWLDFVSGIGVNALGYAHPRLVAELRDQCGKILHLSNLYENELQAELAARLARATGLDLVFFSNSGAEAVECALKVARRAQNDRSGPRGLLALEGSFHGRTLGAVSCTATEAYRAPFEPLVPGVAFVEPEDTGALEAALETRAFGALLVEPIQGEAGVRPLSDAYLRAARRLTTEYGALLVFDEIQSGGGRTGDFLAGTPSGVVPDIVTLAKPIGAGIPIGATIARAEVGEALAPGDHGSTFGGGPLAMRAGLVFLDELFEKGLLARVAEVGDRLGRGFDRLNAEHACVAEHRGRGLMRALVLDRAAAPVAAGLRERGLLVNATAGNVLRVLPPYVITDEDCDEALSLIDDELSAREGQTK